MKKRILHIRHRFSFLILPIAFAMDAIILTVMFIRFFHFPVSGTVWLLGFWFILSIFTRFYGVDRHTSYNELLTLFFKHIFIYFLGVLAFLHFVPVKQFDNTGLLLYLVVTAFFLLLFKTFYFILLKKYRSYGYNLRNYVIFGFNPEINQFQKLLDQRSDYGYKFTGYFANESLAGSMRLGDFKDGLEFIRKHPEEVDVVFSSIKELSDKQLEQLIKVTENHFKHLKFIPDNKEIFKKKLEIEYFEYYPVLSIQKSPLDKPFNAFVKRSFDIIFSLVIILGILSWLTPILALLIKLESKGPVFFKQLRNGLNYKPFYCYKFRSMRPNKWADIKQVSQNDNRVTWIGRFLRKMSIDELPQFFNVLKGEMSVVGPRPHMIAENERFRKKVEKFLGRHYVRPGITGLAQVKGYRGEVVDDSDIINRVKYDMYYIENWSIFLDIKIILQTIINIFKGDKKAY